MCCKSRGEREKRWDGEKRRLRSMRTMVPEREVEETREVMRV